MANFWNETGSEISARAKKWVWACSVIVFFAFPAQFQIWRPAEISARAEIRHPIVTQFQPGLKFQPGWNSPCNRPLRSVKSDSFHVYTPFIFPWQMMTPQDLFSIALLKNNTNRTFTQNMCFIGRWLVQAFNHIHIMSQSCIIPYSSLTDWRRPAKGVLWNRSWTEARGKLRLRRKKSQLQENKWWVSKSSKMLAESALGNLSYRSNDLLSAFFNCKNLPASCNKYNSKRNVIVLESSGRV